ncbi:hypothetical protein [Mesorhizobium sp.]|uniref:hypothetical protein n=1 Tax=Mesorhizobium sp. TaxID=1871066 RepID=UPI002579B046|nr:hypothetical protein [Mesorhizobium sp.]
METAFFASTGFFETTAFFAETFSAFADAGFFAFTAATFFAFAEAVLFSPASCPAFGVAVLSDAVMKPWSARWLKGAPLAAPMAKVITPAATAAVKTVNFCMGSCSVSTARRTSRSYANQRRNIWEAVGPTTCTDRL